MHPLQAFFQSISPLQATTWDVLFPLFKPASLKAGEFFITEHSIAHQIAYLHTGCARAFFTNAKGKEYNKQFFVGPSLIGAYTSLLTGQANRIPQQALTDCEIWVADFPQIQALYEHHHDLERLGRKIAEMYFLEKEAKELEMALEDASQRYLNFQKRYPTLEQEIPQYHIASYLSITTTQLSRIRRKLSQSPD